MTGRSPFSRTASLVASGLVLTAALVAPAGALAHGDAPSHYLETDAGLLYPAFGSRPTQSLELELLGLLQASADRGYPIRVALIANVEDVPDAPDMVSQPQAYAEFIAVELEDGLDLVAPVLVVTANGFGVSGAEVRDGRLVQVTAATARMLVEGVDVPAEAHGDALARAAMVAVRQIARIGGHPLPPSVAPARPISGALPGSSLGLGDQGGIDWLPLAVFGAVFLPAWILYEVLIGAAKRRGNRVDATDCHDVDP